MNKNLLINFDNVDQLIKEQDFPKAMGILKSLVGKYPTEGIIPYYFGRICLAVKEEQLAVQYFQKAIEMNCCNTDVYLSLALLQKNIGTTNEAEKNFNHAIERVKTQEERWASFSCLAVFYIENKMYMKADKIAKAIINEFPDNYQGYHLHTIIDTLKGDYEDAISYLKMIPERFKRHPQYLIDIIDVYKNSDKKEKLPEIFNHNLTFTEVIPQIVLREKIIASFNSEDNEEKEELIQTLANNYHDKDAIFAVLVLEFSRRNFKKASYIANIILENELENLNIRYYLALYFQIYNFYYMSDCHPSEKLVKWIENSAKWCVEFVDQFNIPEISLPLRKSLQNLFDEINTRYA